MEIQGIGVQPNGSIRSEAGFWFFFFPPLVKDRDLLRQKTVEVHTKQIRHKSNASKDQRDALAPRRFCPGY